MTRHVALLHKWMAADLYSKEVDLLQFELSMPKCSRELWGRCRKIQRSLVADSGDATRAPPRLFRAGLERLVLPFA